MNHALSPKEYEACVSLSGSIQALYDDAPGYIARDGLDPEIFLPGNEWAGIDRYLGVHFDRSDAAASIGS